MDEFGFIRGNEVTIAVNGSALGGVFSAVCKTENNLIKIEEFLTDKPVYSVAVPSYTITLKTRRSPDEIIGQAIDSVELSGGGKTVSYTSCAVKDVYSRVLPKGILEYGVVIAADKRSVEYE